MKSQTYNWVYRKLVQGPDDVVGALAYVLYKQQKIAFIEQIQRDQQREPNEQELQSFHTISALPETLASYQQRAEALADQFLEIALAARLQQAETEIRQSTTLHMLASTKTDLTHVVQASQALLTSRTDSILAELQGKKTIGGWLREVGGNLLVSVLTIVVVGALYTGYQWLSVFNSNLEKHSGAAQHPAPPPGRP
jgi:hypothetical protein